MNCSERTAVSRASVLNNSKIWTPRLLKLARHCCSLLIAVLICLIVVCIRDPGDINYFFMGLAIAGLIVLLACFSMLTFCVTTRRVARVLRPDDEYENDALEDQVSDMPLNVSFRDSHQQLLEHTIVSAPTSPGVRGLTSPVSPNDHLETRDGQCQAAGQLLPNVQSNRQMTGSGREVEYSGRHLVPDSPPPYDVAVDFPPTATSDILLESTETPPPPFECAIILDSQIGIVHI